MPKLFELKKWLTLADAARHLSAIFDDAVTPADLLQLAIGGSLKLSVHFVNGADGRRGKVLSNNEATCTAWIKGKTRDTALGQLSGGAWTGKGIDGALEAMRKHAAENGRSQELELAIQAHGVSVSYLGIPLDEKYIVEPTDQIKSLRGIWDIPMIGAEVLDIQQRYQLETRGPEVTLVSLEGAWVGNKDEGFYEIQQINEEDEERSAKDLENVSALNPERYSSIDSLPFDGTIVVRTSALVDFCQIATQAEPTPEKAMDPREYNTLLVIIEALAQQAKIKTNDKEAAGKIKRLTEFLKAPIHDKTIRKHLRNIPNALEKKSN